ncbi:MAG: hypothetical protein V3U89_02010 [Methylophilaceae bacterium]
MSHQLLGGTHHGFTYTQTIIRIFIVHSAMFLIASAIPMIGSVLIAKLPKENRTKPYYQYFKIALAMTWALALLGLYYGWYAIQAANS